LLSDIGWTEYVCSDATIIPTYAIVLQLQYSYVISRFTSHYVTKKTNCETYYTLYILYINDEAEIVNKDSPRKRATVVTTMMMCDDDDYNDSE